MVRYICDIIYAMSNNDCSFINFNYIQLCRKLLLINLLKCIQKMLAKVEYGGVQKYIKVPQIDENLDFLRCLQEGLYLYYNCKRKSLKKVNLEV